MDINKELKKYVEEEVLPLYDRNEEGHGILHIEYVIRRSLEFAKQFSDLNMDMVYVIAAFHDIAHYIDKDNHEVLSASVFYSDDKMKQFFSKEERTMIKVAIEDHRASLKGNPRSVYGMIVSSADRNTDLDFTLKRVHSYTRRHYPEYTLEEELERGYHHILEKYGKQGYVKMYVEDKEYQCFLK